MKSETRAQIVIFGTILSICLIVGGIMLVTEVTNLREENFLLGLYEHKYRMEAEHYEREFEYLHGEYNFTVHTEDIFVMSTGNGTGHCFEYGLKFAISDKDLLTFYKFLYPYNMRRPEIFTLNGTFLGVER